MTFEFGGYLSESVQGGGMRYFALLPAGLGLPPWWHLICSVMAHVA